MYYQEIALHDDSFLSLRLWTIPIILVLVVITSRLSPFSIIFNINFNMCYTSTPTFSYGTKKVFWDVSRHLMSKKMNSYNSLVMIVMLMSVRLLQRWLKLLEKKHSLYVHIQAKLTRDRVSLVAIVTLFAKLKVPLVDIVESFAFVVYAILVVSIS